jgi:hypothetical protein
MVRNFYIPTGPTDFTEPLSKVYKRQSRQTEQWLRDQLEHSKQIQEADSGVALLKTLNQAMQTATAVKGAADKWGERKEKKKTKKAVEMENKMRANVITKKDKEVLAEYVKYKKSKREIYKEGLSWEDFLAKQKITPRLKKQLQEAGPGESLRIQEWQIGQLARNGKAEYDKYIKSIDGTEEGKVARKWIEDNPDASHYSEWFVTQYGKDYKLTSEAAGALLAPEVQRQSRTIQGVNNNAFNAKILTEGAALFSERIDTARVTWGAAGNNGDELSSLFQSRVEEVKNDKLATFQIPEGGSYSKEQIEEARSHAQEKVGNELYALARTGKLTFTEFQGLRSGNIIGHPSGDTANIMLNQGQWDQIESGITEASNIAINSDIAKKKQNIINADAAYRAGEGSLREVNVAQNAFINAGGDKNDDIYKRSIGYSQGNNTKEAYDLQRKPFERYMTGDMRGSLGNDTGMLAEINAITNDDLRNELLAQYKSETKILETVKAPNRQESTKQVKTLIIDQGLDKTLKEDSELSGELVHMVDEIVAKRNWFLMNQDPNQPFAKELADKAWRDWLTSEGFFSKGKENDPNYGGKFSPNKRGKYPKYAAIRYGQIEATRKTGYSRTEDTLDLEGYTRNLSAGLLEASKNPVPGKTVVDTFIDTPESTLTRDDIVGAYTVNRGEVFYSEELQIKAHALGIQPSILLQRQTEALIKTLDKEDPLMKAIDLPKLVKEIDLPTGDVTIRDRLVEVKDGELIYAWEFIGPNNMSPNLLRRTAAALGTLDRIRQNVYVPTVAEIEEIEKQIEIEKESRKWTPPDTHQGDLTNVNSDIG